MNAIDKMVAKYVESRKGLKTHISKNEQDKAFIKLQRLTKYLSRVEVKTWREAHQAAIDIENPRRDYAMDVYDDAMLDPHLKTVTQSRILNVVNTPGEIYQIDNNEVNEDLAKLFDRMWFYDFIKLAVESVLYGYSPVKFYMGEGRDLAWEVKKVRCFHREHFVPEWRAVRKDLSSNDLIYIDEPPYNRFYMIIDTGELGLLLQCSRFTIFKKYAVNHWSRYQDLFGIPARTVKTNSRDDAVWDKLESQLKAMGNSLSAVLPEGTDFQIHSDNTGDPYNVFLQAAKFADEQNSKIILGQTMTTDDGSSKSQSEVHERTAGNITKADIRFAEHIINDQLFPFLIDWGYPLEGMAYRFDQSSKLKLADSQLEIDTWVSQQFDIDEQYVEEVYGAKIVGRKQFNPFPGQPAKPEPTGKQ
jgi:hypothetical protein